MAELRMAALLVELGPAAEPEPEDDGDVEVARGATLVDTGVAAASVAFLHEMLVAIVKLSASVTSAH